MTQKVNVEMLEAETGAADRVVSVDAQGNMEAKVIAGLDPSVAAQVATNTQELADLAIDLATLLDSSISNSKTQWSGSTWAINPVPIADSSDALLLGLIDNVANKNAGVTDATDELNIVPHQTKPIDVIKTTYHGGTTIHNIRLTLDITTGNEQHYVVQICRGSDDTVVASYQMERNPDEPTTTVDLVTFTYKADDPYVTDGFYIRFVNNSGVAAELSGAYSLTIFNQYQYLIEVI